MNNPNAIFCLAGKHNWVGFYSGVKKENLDEAHFRICRDCKYEEHYIWGDEWINYDTEGCLSKPSAHAYVL